MGSSAAVDTEGMHRAGQIIIDTRESAVTVQNGVRDDIAGLKSSWQDAGSQEFHAAMDNWLATYNSVVSELGRIGEKLSENTATYRTAATTAVDDAAALMKIANSQAGLPGL